MKRPLISAIILAVLTANLPASMAQDNAKHTVTGHLPLPASSFYSTSDFTGEVLTSRNALAGFLAKQFPAAQYGELRVVGETKSPLGTHYIIRQFYHNKPVYKTELKLNVSPSGEVMSVITGLHTLPKKRSLRPVHAPETMAAQHLVNLLGTNLAKADYTVEETVFLADNSLSSGIVVTYGSRNTSVGSKEILLDASGRVRDEYNLITNYKHNHDHNHGHGHSHQQNNIAAKPTKALIRDTAVTALIYPAMPPYRNMQGIEKTLAGKPEKIKVQLEANRQKVEIQAAIRNDTFLLQSPFCIVKEFDPPAMPVVYSLSPNFNYQLGDEGFEQVNVLYHITAWQRYIQQLGFTNLVNYQLEVDANGWNGQDQSSYSAFTNTLSFGIGGIADAQDPQVIIHEYSHAVSRSASAGPAIGYARKVLEEANADYFAVSYKKATDPSDWQRIFTWDGHNEFWAGRMAVSNKIYPAGMSGDIYDDAALWTATLMEIQEQIGREATDRLVLQSLYSYSSYLDIPGAAKLLLQADSLLYKGRHMHHLSSFFGKRGILAMPALANSNRLAPPVTRVAGAAGFLSLDTVSPTPTFSALAHPKSPTPTLLKPVKETPTPNFACLSKTPTPTLHLNPVCEGKTHNPTPGYAAPPEAQAPVAQVKKKSLQRSPHNRAGAHGAYKRAIFYYHATTDPLH